MSDERKIELSCYAGFILRIFVRAVTKKLLLMGGIASEYIIWSFYVLIKIDLTHKQPIVLQSFICFFQ